MSGWTKTMTKWLEWVAKQKGRSHHDASYEVSPPEARAILALRAKVEQAEAERDEAHAVLALAAKRFAAGDREGLRLILCDMNARENARAALRGEEE